MTPSANANAVLLPAHLVTASDNASHRSAIVRACRLLIATSIRLLRSLVNQLQRRRRIVPAQDRHVLALQDGGRREEVGEFIAHSRGKVVHDLHATTLVFFGDRDNAV